MSDKKDFNPLDFDAFFKGGMIGAAILIGSIVVAVIAVPIWAVVQLIGFATRPQPIEPTRKPNVEVNGPFELADLPALRILLAEDNLVNQKLAVRLLEKAGHVVVVALNGMLAVEITGRERFDLVLMDVQMPVMGGLEATAAIREREILHSARHLPIIAMTANAMKGDREVCLTAGMDDYVAKPIQSRILAETIAAVLAATWLPSHIQG